MTILRFERHPVDGGRLEAFEREVSAFLETIRAAPGVLWADASKAFDDDPSYIIMSEWRTADDAEAFASGADSAAFTDRTHVMLRSDVTRRTFTAGS